VTDPGAEAGGRRDHHDLRPTSLETFDGLELHLCVQGAGPPVVLLHGFGSSTQINWINPGTAQALVQAGHEVIGLDARGHGRSQKPHAVRAYANDTMVKDVVSLFDALELAAADVVGYSMGAATALGFALRDERVRRLVLGGVDLRMLEGLMGAPSGEWRARSIRIAQALEADDRAAIADPVAKSYRRFAEWTGADRLALAACQRALAERAPRTAWPATGGSSQQERLGLAQIEEVMAPTLVICGDRDVSPFDLARRFRHGTATVVPGTHLSAVTKPEFITAIVNFLGP